MVTPLLFVSARRHAEPVPAGKAAQSTNKGDCEFELLIDRIGEEALSGNDNDCDLHEDDTNSTDASHLLSGLIVVPIHPPEHETKKDPGQAGCSPGLAATQYLHPSIASSGIVDGEAWVLLDPSGDARETETLDHRLTGRTEDPLIIPKRSDFDPPTNPKSSPDRDGSGTASEIERPPAPGGLVHNAVESAPEIAPALPPSVQILQQISSGILQGAGPPVTAPTAPQTHIHYPIGDHPSPLKSLRFTLQPEEMGEVEVTLRRVGTDTKVTIRVASTEAADAVRRDMNILEDRIGSLLSATGSNSTTISMDIRGSDSAQASIGTGHWADSAEFARDRGSRQEGRSEARARQISDIGKGETDEDSPHSSNSPGVDRVV